MDTEYLGYILKLTVSCFCLHQGRRRTEKNVVRHEPESASKKNKKKIVVWEPKLF